MGPLAGRGAHNGTTRWERVSQFDTWMGEGSTMGPPDGRGSHSLTHGWERGPLWEEMTGERFLNQCQVNNGRLGIKTKLSNVFKIKYVSNMGGHQNLGFVSLTLKALYIMLISDELPRLSSCLHTVGQCDVIRPYVKLPLAQSQNPTVDTPTMDTHTHVQLLNPCYITHQPTKRYISHVKCHSNVYNASYVHVFILVFTSHQHSVLVIMLIPL